MIDKRYNSRGTKLYVPTCDCCGDELSAEWEYEDAVGAIRAANWGTKKIDGAWVNYCADCLSMMNNAASEFED